MTLKKVEGGIYAQESVDNEIRDIDGIIFDCDGVLVDVSNSYDLAIQRTTAYILKEIANISKSDPVTSKIIDGFEVIKNADQTGIKSVEKFLDNSNANITVLKKKLNYPGRHLDNLLYSIFDQIFYGPKLYFKLFKKNSNFTEQGLIENDIVLVKKELLEILKKKLGKKIAIVSGRGIESIRYSLEELLDEFDIENSIFLEDESRELAKPNPDSLIRTFKGIGSSHCLYVGDSMEDFIMAQKATETGNKITFCGIIGTSKYPEEKKKLFEEKNVPLILNSIDLLPKALNLV